MSRTLCLIVSAVLLTGCAEKWEKVGATEQEFDGMKAACSSRAYSMFPPTMRQIQLTSGYTTPVSMSCSYIGYTQNCVQTGGGYVAPITMLVDDNQGGRTQSVRSCFFQDGWTPAKKS